MIFQGRLLIAGFISFIALISAYITIKSFEAIFSTGFVGFMFFTPVTLLMALLTRKLFRSSKKALTTKL